MPFGWDGWNSITRYDRFMLIASVFSRFFLVFQIALIINNQSSENVSYIAYFIAVLSSFSWLIYGALHKNVVISLSASLGYVGGLLALILIALYREGSVISF